MIIFLFSFSEVGGVPTLFYNIANYLYSNQVEFKLIAKKNSEIHFLFLKIGKSLNFYDYDMLCSYQDIEGFVSINDTIVLTYWDPNIYFLRKINPKILFWNVFPDTLYFSNHIWGRFFNHRINKQLVNLMILKEGLVFMDDSPSIWIKKYYKNGGIKFVFLPIPVDASLENRFIRNFICNSNIDVFKISYIGRSETWKLFPLIHIIDDLRKINCHILLSVVTDDIMKSKKFVSEFFPDKFEYLRIQFYANVPNYNLSNFLIDHSHLNIGMGTACLEGAKIGIPSLLVNASNSFDIGKFSYQWLFDTENFRLGSFERFSEHKSFDSLKSIILSYTSSNDFVSKHSHLCFNYVKQNHNLSFIGEEFLRFIRISDLRSKDIINSVFIYSPLYRFKSLVKGFLHSLR